MAEIFPPWSNRVPRYVLAGIVGLPLLAVLVIAYTFSPEYTDVGYKPRQPIPYSHKLHVGELELDCRYCHAAVEVARMAAIPPTHTCMNCHSLVGTRAESLQPLRDSMDTGEPIHWVRVHDLPDYAYFDHRAHVVSGIGCETCHGKVDQMEEIRQVEPLSMRWCLDCHRDPGPWLRPREHVFDMNWEPPSDPTALAEALEAEYGVNPPTDCSGCHR